MTAVTQTRRVGARSTARDLRARFARLPVHVTVAIVMAIWLVPTLGLIVNSFRTVRDMTQAGWWTTLFPPANFTLASYQAIFQTQGFSNSIVNSLLITIPATVLQVVIATFAGYAFAWMKFRGRDLFFLVIVGLMVVPVQLTFIPVLKLFAATGLAGTFIAVWLAHAGYGLPFQTYLLRSYIGSLPKEVFESAEIDGANHVVRFWRIVVPMSIPAIAANVIFVFLGVWNDLLIAVTYLGQSPNRPLTVFIGQQTTSLGGNWQVLTAAAVIQMALPLAVFLGLQRYFVRGISAGAVKG
ncbi:MAG TPA: carbohydrate ABC transporter permease [Candidatus Limnocylindrales bacterium]|jgi:alpha-glucoside transport system permease protein|nr:carbohydrate ABC transporter permease [Candidatus Limnocylindrales bacterium]